MVLWMLAVVGTMDPVFFLLLQSLLSLCTSSHSLGILSHMVLLKKNSSIHLVLYETKQQSKLQIIYLLTFTCNNAERKCALIQELMKFYFHLLLIHVSQTAENISISILHSWQSQLQN
jgi:hypothetical protein